MASDLLLYQEVAEECRNMTWYMFKVTLTDALIDHLNPIQDWIGKILAQNGDTIPCPFCDMVHASSRAELPSCKGAVVPPTPATPEKKIKKIVQAFGTTDGLIVCHVLPEKLYVLGLEQIVTGLEIPSSLRLPSLSIRTGPV